MNLAEHDYEPVRGLPQRPPEGEQILWQGAPDWRLMARRSLHMPVLAAYFALLVSARAVAVALRGESLPGVVLDALWFVLPSLLVLGLVAAFAWGVARTTVYTITNRRVVMRFGIALSITANLPYALIENAGARLQPDGTGDLTLGLVQGQRISFLFFWPHVRPWRIGRPQPALRALADGAEAARILARALSVAAEMPVAAAPVAAGTAGNNAGAQPAPA